MTDSILSFFHHFGILTTFTLVIFLTTALTNWSPRSFEAQIFSSAAFALMTLVLINAPIQLPTGAHFDMRAAPLVLSAIYGGPVAAVVTAVVASVARYQMGGPMALGGAISPFF